LDGVVQQMGQADPGEDGEGGRFGRFGFQIFGFLRFQISDFRVQIGDYCRLWALKSFNSEI
jgi:hypothetical protein